MVDNFEKRDKEIRERIIWRQDEIFDAIWDDKINKFFENYKKFDKFLVQKSNSILAYWWHIFLDAEVSEKLHGDFYDAFCNSIEWIVGEKIFKRMLIYFEQRDYILSTREKMFDLDPFLNDWLISIVLWNNTVAQLMERRDEANHVEFNYVIYPNRIFHFINTLLKENNIQI